MPAVLHFLQGEAKVTLDAHSVEARPNTWVHMPTGQRHGIHAKTPVVMLLLLLEIPLVGFVIAPERTVVEVQRFRAWLSRSGRRLAILGCAGIGALLVARGVIESFT